MTTDFIEPQPSDDNQEHPLGADRIAAMVTDLPPLTGTFPNAEIPLEAQAADMVQEMLYAVEKQLVIVDSQISEHTDGSGRLVCWTVQRVETWSIARTTQQHVPTWATVRADRRPLYAMMSNAMILRGLICAENPSPPVWAYVANERNKPPASNLQDLVCDSSCGNGLPVCPGHHVPPGHTALLMSVDPTQVVASNYSRWDLALSGAYIPADYLDATRFHRLLSTVYPGGAAEPISARDWTPVSTAIRKSPLVANGKSPPPGGGGVLRSGALTCFRAVFHPVGI
ncbi:hypothetical protein, partial [Nocardia sp. XZ_19_231]|uniref:hypothetical protein n=1 Tax=Nocardia sp. XZ_19_231 TaxID=2769252 RepID=UPI00188DCAA4